MDINKLTNIPVIDCGDFYLRALKLNDAVDMFEYARDDETTEKLSWPSHKDLDETKQCIKDNFLNRPEYGVPSAYAIVLKENDKMIGTCDFWMVNFRNNYGEIGYVLNKKYWGRGITTGALKELIKFGFEYLGLERIQIAHETQNIASQRVIEKCDFRLEGLKRHAARSKSGKYVDHKIYSILKDEYFNKELNWL